MKTEKAEKAIIYNDSLIGQRKHQHRSDKNITITKRNLDSENRQKNRNPLDVITYNKPSMTNTNSFPNYSKDQRAGSDAQFRENQQYAGMDDFENMLVEFQVPSSSNVIKRTPEPTYSYRNNIKSIKPFGSFDEKGDSHIHLLEDQQYASLNESNNKNSEEVPDTNIMNRVPEPTYSYRNNLKSIKPFGSFDGKAENNQPQFKDQKKHRDKIAVGESSTTIIKHAPDPTDSYWQTLKSTKPFGSFDDKTDGKRQSRDNYEYTGGIDRIEKKVTEPSSNRIVDRAPEPTNSYRNAVNSIKPFGSFDDKGGKKPNLKDKQRYAGTNEFEVKVAGVPSSCTTIAAPEQENSYRTATKSIKPSGPVEKNATTLSANGIPNRTQEPTYSYRKTITSMEPFGSFDDNGGREQRSTPSPRYNHLDGFKNKAIVVSSSSSMNSKPGPISNSIKDTSIDVYENKVLEAPSNSIVVRRPEPTYSYRNNIKSVQCFGSFDDSVAEIDVHSYNDVDARFRGRVSESRAIVSHVHQPQGHQSQGRQMYSYQGEHEVQHQHRQRADDVFVSPETSIASRRTIKDVNKADVRAVSEAAEISFPSHPSNPNAPPLHPQLSREHQAHEYENQPHHHQYPPHHRALPLRRQEINSSSSDGTTMTPLTQTKLSLQHEGESAQTAESAQKGAFSNTGVLSEWDKAQHDTCNQDNNASRPSNDCVTASTTPKDLNKSDVKAISKDSENLDKAHSGRQQSRQSHQTLHQHQQQPQRQQRDRVAHPAQSGDKHATTTEVEQGKRVCNPVGSVTFFNPMTLEPTNPAQLGIQSHNSASSEDSEESSDTVKKLIKKFEVKKVSNDSGIPSSGHSRQPQQYQRQRQSKSRPCHRESRPASSNDDQMASKKEIPLSQADQRNSTLRSPNKQLLAYSNAVTTDTSNRAQLEIDKHNQNVSIPGVDYVESATAGQDPNKLDVQTNSKRERLQNKSQHQNEHIRHGSSSINQIASIAGTTDTCGHEEQGSGSGNKHTVRFFNPADVIGPNKVNVSSTDSLGPLTSPEYLSKSVAESPSRIPIDCNPHEQTPQPSYQNDNQYHQSQHQNERIRQGSSSTNQMASIAGTTGARGYKEQGLGSGNEQMVRFFNPADVFGTDQVSVSSTGSLGPLTSPEYLSKSVAESSSRVPIDGNPHQSTSQPKYQNDKQYRQQRENERRDRPNPSFGVAGNQLLPNAETAHSRTHQELSASDSVNVKVPAFSNSGTMGRSDQQQNHIKSSKQGHGSSKRSEGFVLSSGESEGLVGLGEGSGLSYHGYARQLPACQFDQNQQKHERRPQHQETGHHQHEPYSVPSRRDKGWGLDALDKASYNGYVDQPDQNQHQAQNYFQRQYDNTSNESSSVPSGRDGALDALDKAAGPSYHNYVHQSDQNQDQEQNYFQLQYDNTFNESSSVPSRRDEVLDASDKAPRLSYHGCVHQSDQNQYQEKIIYQEEHDNTYNEPSSVPSRRDEALDAFDKASGLSYHGYVHQSDHNQNQEQNQYHEEYANTYNEPSSVPSRRDKALDVFDKASALSYPEYVHPPPVHELVQNQHQEQNYRQHQYNNNYSQSSSISSGRDEGLDAFDKASGPFYHGYAHQAPADRSDQYQHHHQHRHRYQPHHEEQNHHQNQFEHIYNLSPSMSSRRGKGSDLFDDHDAVHQPSAHESDLHRHSEAPPVSSRRNKSSDPFDEAMGPSYHGHAHLPPADQSARQQHHQHQPRRKEQNHHQSQFEHTDNISSSRSSMRGEGSDSFDKGSVLSYDGYVHQPSAHQSDLNQHQHQRHHQEQDHRRQRREYRVASYSNQMEINEVASLSWPDEGGSASNYSNVAESNQARLVVGSHDHEHGPFMSSLGSAVYLNAVQDFDRDDADVSPRSSGTHTRQHDENQLHEKRYHQQVRAVDKLNEFEKSNAEPVTSFSNYREKGSDARPRSYVDSIPKDNLECFYKETAVKDLKKYENLDPQLNAGSSSKYHPKETEVKPLHSRSRYHDVLTTSNDEVETTASETPVKNYENLYRQIHPSSPLNDHLTGTGVDLISSERPYNNVETISKETALEDSGKYENLHPQYHAACSSIHQKKVGTNPTDVAVKDLCTDEALDTEENPIGGEMVSNEVSSEEIIPQSLAQYKNLQPSLNRGAHPACSCCKDSCSECQKRKKDTEINYKPPASQKSCDDGKAGFQETTMKDSNGFEKVQPELSKEEVGACSCSQGTCPQHKKNENNITEKNIDLQSNQHMATNTNTISNSKASAVPNRFCSAGCCPGYSDRFCSEGCRPALPVHFCSEGCCPGCCAVAPNRCCSEDFFAGPPVSLYSKGFCSGCKKKEKQANSPRSSYVSSLVDSLTSDEDDSFDYDCDEVTSRATSRAERRAARRAAKAEASKEAISPGAKDKSSFFWDIFNIDKCCGGMNTKGVL